MRVQVQTATSATPSEIAARVIQPRKKAARRRKTTALVKEEEKDEKCNVSWVEAVEEVVSDWHIFHVPMSIENIKAAKKLQSKYKFQVDIECNMPLVKAKNLERARWIQ